MSKPTRDSLRRATDALYNEQPAVPIDGVLKDPEHFPTTVRIALAIDEAVDAAVRGMFEVVPCMIEGDEYHEVIGVGGLTAGAFGDSVARDQIDRIVAAVRATRDEEGT